MRACRSGQPLRSLETLGALQALRPHRARSTRRRGKSKAVVAVGRSILVIVWHLLSDPETRFADLGADFYDTRRSTAARKRQHIRELEALGYRGTLHPAA